MSKPKESGVEGRAVELPEDALATPATRASAHYERRFPVRAAIQAIPMLGGTIDTMLAGPAVRWQAKRLESFIQMLSERLATLEQSGVKVSVEPNEPLYDLVR